MMLKKQTSLMNYEDLFFVGSPWEKYCFGLGLKSCSELMLKATRGLKEFWGDGYCKGWISDRAYEQLSTARLDRWLSITYLLNEWFNESINKQFSNDQLRQSFQIIGWVNLGAMLECSIKLFLTVHIETYEEDNDAYRNNKTSELMYPESLTLDKLKQFFSKKKIVMKPDEWTEWILCVQRQRNGIHCFKDRHLADFNELGNNLKLYTIFLIHLYYLMPHPPDEEVLPGAMIEFEKENILHRCVTDG
jgi:hypothetical protein